MCTQCVYKCVYKCVYTVRVHSVCIPHAPPTTRTHVLPSWCIAEDQKVCDNTGPYKRTVRIPLLTLMVYLMVCGFSTSLSPPYKGVYSSTVVEETHLSTASTSLHIPHSSFLIPCSLFLIFTRPLFRCSIHVACSVCVGHSIITMQHLSL